MSWKEKKETLGKEIIGMLYDSQMIRTWYRDKHEGWTLHSGLWSPIYINLRHLGSFPSVFKKVSIALGQLIKEECKSVNKVVGIATAGVPISAAIGIEASIPCGYTRKIDAKNVEEFRKKISKYGQHAIVEGNFEDGDEIVLVDDLVTRMTSKLIAVEQFRAEMERRSVNAKSNKILVLLDREQGAQKTATENGLELFSLIPFKSKGVKWLEDRFTSLEYEVISDYLLNSDKYQDETIQNNLKNQARE